MNEITRDGQRSRKTKKRRPRETTTAHNVHEKKKNTILEEFDFAGGSIDCDCDCDVIDEIVINVIAIDGPGRDRRTLQLRARHALRENSPTIPS